MREIEIKVHSFKFKKLFALTACACMALGVVSIPVQAQDIKNTGTGSITYTGDATQSLSEGEQDVLSEMQNMMLGGPVTTLALYGLKDIFLYDNIQYGSDVTDKMMIKTNETLAYLKENKKALYENQFNGYELEKNYKYASYLSGIFEVIGMKYVYDDEKSTSTIYNKDGSVFRTVENTDRRKTPLETATEDAKDPSKIIEAINNTERPSVEITFEKESEVQTKAVFEAAKAAGKKLFFKTGIYSRDTITFKFNEGITNPVDMNFGLEQVVNAGIVKDLEGAVAFNFKHNGALPGPMTVRMFNKAYEDIKEPTELYLYLLDETTGKLVKQEQVAIVDNGWLEFTITHCSSYVTTLSELKEDQVQVADPVVTPETPKTDKEEVIKETGNETSAGLGFKTLALITLCGAAVFITTRKEKA